MQQVALITGAARRVGAAITRYLHQQGMCVIVHYNQSAAAAESLVAELNQQRSDSARLLRADLRAIDALPECITEAASFWGGLSVLINNASLFYPTPLAQATPSAWDDLMMVNAQAPFFLSQAAAPCLAKQQGCIVNILDTHHDKVLRDHPLYSVSKAALASVTRVLAKELAPAVRVNAVAPGVVAWPEGQNSLDSTQKQTIIDKTLLHRAGTGEDVAKAVYFLVNDAGFTTGQIIHVDGGRYC